MSVKRSTGSDLRGLRERAERGVGRATASDRRDRGWLLGGLL